MTSDVVECSVAGDATAGGITEVVRLTTSGVQTSTTPDFGGWTVDDGAGDWARSTPSKLHTAAGPSQSQAYELAPGAAIGNGWATCTASATSIRCASTSRLLHRDCRRGEQELARRVGPSEVRS